MLIEPIGYIYTDFKEKFGIPRQSGRVQSLVGRVVLLPEFKGGEALRGIEEFSHLWLIFGFSKAQKSRNTLTVRPPRLGGNKRIGVFASRSPFRPNSLGLSVVKLERVEGEDLIVSGVDILDGTPIYDSVAANACAHYLHNMLYVCGEIGYAESASDVRAVLLRTNDIENFDTATVSFKLSSGAECLFIASHSTDVNRNPRFDYRFEHATVSYDENTKDIVAHLDDGSEIHYGNPFAGAPDGGKSRLAIDGTRSGNYAPACTPYTAAEHARCIEAIQQFPIIDVARELVENKDDKLYVKGLTEALYECYEKQVLLDGTELYERLVK